MEPEQHTQQVQVQEGPSSRPPRRGRNQRWRQDRQGEVPDTGPSEAHQGEEYPRGDYPGRGAGSGRRGHGRGRGGGRGGSSSPNVDGGSKPASAHPSRAGTPDHDKSSKPKFGGSRGGRAAKFNPALTGSADTGAGDGPSHEKHEEPAEKHRRHRHRPNPTGSVDAAGHDSKHEESAEKYRRHPRPHHRSGTSQALAGADADDLTSTLIKSLSTKPYPDCPICFSSIHPAQPSWSCSPAIPQILSTSDSEVNATAQYCWTTFHLKCIRSWAEKSVKTLEEAWRNRGEMDKKGEWRCPGCQAKREVVPTSYWCFCNSTPDPKPSRLATPHSCANSCTRDRESGCGHPCPLLCHPGPCPPCKVTIQLPCPCPRKKVVTFRCGDETYAKKGKSKAGGGHVTTVSCGAACGRQLDCGTHLCEKTCHPGPCGGCELEEEVTCYCGKSKKNFKCGEGNGVPSFIREDDGSERSWIGRFECEAKCDRLFDCGIHRCQKPCHQQSVDPAPCPFSPSKITHCPCGRNLIAPSSSSDSPPTSKYAFPARQECTAPIPTCDSVCGNIHTLCGHACSAKCHVGPCPPCGVPSVRPCRCGMMTREVLCSELISSTRDGEKEEKEILCDRPCAVIRACGKHECRRLCCPLASLAVGKGKKGRAPAEVGVGEEEGGLHECDLVCGRLLSCGNHTCEKRDHKGPCPTCLQSSFEEAICPCGRTILEPPIPCGTKINCRYQCMRMPACGHPPISHSCHEELPDSSCPPCVYLTTKPCACGKKEIVNVKCSLEREKVSCATTCGRLLSCGFHRCQRLCHAGDCGACTTPCGKDRKLCLPAHHPCTRPCHAPSACSEDDPCQALITLTCPCERISQAARCNRTLQSISNSDSSIGTRQSLKCNTHCEIAKRNSRLAEALGITPETRERATKGMASGPAVYPDEVLAFAKEDPKFVLLVEKAFAEFVASSKRSQVLPHMSSEKRKFVHNLASIYRFDAQMVDQEPLRSVQIVRRVDTRVPSPLLSAHVASLSGSAPNLGKLSLTTGSSRGATVKTGMVTPPVAGKVTSGIRGWGPSQNVRTSVGGGGATAGPTSVATPEPTVRAVPVPAARAVLPTPPSRSLTPTPVNVTQVEDVPDNWEDDAEEVQLPC